MSPPNISFNFCFTENQPLKSDHHLYGEKLKLFCKHYQYSLEKSSRLHYQGVVSLKERVTLSKAVSLFHAAGMAPHLEIIKGTYKDNLQYTSKPDTHVAGPWMDGTPPIDDNVIPDNFSRYVIVMFGPPKTCKTTTARLICEYYGDGCYMVPAKNKNSSGRWIGEYKGEESAIIEEFDFRSDFEPNQWKQLLDRVPQQISGTMGGKGSILWKPSLIILTSNNPVGRGHPFLSDTFKHRIDYITPWGYGMEDMMERRGHKPTTLAYNPDDFADYVDDFEVVQADSKKRKRVKKS